MAGEDDRGRRPAGFDAAKTIKGRKRNALADIDGCALMLQAGRASIQDRDGAVPLLVKSGNRFPFIERAFADSAYAGDQVANATQIVVEIVRAKPDQVGFAVTSPMGRRTILRLD